MESGVGNWIIGVLVVVAVLLVLIGLVVWAVYRTKPGRSAGGPTARQILDQRYARGEITREQYEQMKDDLDRR